jgi:hypothetical protein
VAASSSTTGKLAWSRDALPPWKPRQHPNGGHQWVGAGIDCDGNRVLVWAEGGAVLRLRDGALLWKARLDDQAPAFPLELSSDEAAPRTVTTPTTIAPWLVPNQNIYNHRYGGGWRRISGSVIYANAMASSGFGYPGMYASGQNPQVIIWGIDDVRRLSGDGIWRINSSAVQAYSVMGLPVRPNTAATVPMGAVVGSVGNTLVGLMDNSASRWHPLRGGFTLWTREAPPMVTNPVEAYAMPAAALAGRVLLLATREQLRAMDVLSGAELWQTVWPEDLKSVVEEGKEAMKTWQSVRWSGRGLFLNDNQRRTLGLDWKSLTAGGDWIVPVGTRTLVCLRGAGGGVESKDENGDSN